MDLAFRDDFDVVLIDSMGSDERICQAARVSTKGAESFRPGESAGLIKFLMKNRHGSPFEHVVFTWMVTCPIFVWREHMRHRMASYNEESGRYKELAPVFYIPPRRRPIIQVGKAGEYRFEQGSEEQYQEIVKTFKKGAQHQYEDYEYLLDLGVAREVSRMELPVNIYSSAYVTMNLRALMNFLSLRTVNDKAAYASFPQWEIQQVARQFEYAFELTAPAAYSAFNEFGRVQP